MRNGKLSKAEKAAGYDALKARCNMLEYFVTHRARAVHMAERIQDRYGDKYKIEADVIDSKSYDALLDVYLDKCHLGVMDLYDLKARAEVTDDPYIKGAMQRLAQSASDHVHKCWDAEKGAVTHAVI